MAYATCDFERKKRGGVFTSRLRHGLTEASVVVVVLVVPFTPAKNPALALDGSLLQD